MYIREATEGLTLEQLREDVMRALHPGDIVQIPAPLRDGSEEVAIVERIFSHHVLLRQRNGLRVSFQYIDAIHLKKIESDFHTDEGDVIAAFNAIADPIGPFNPDFEPVDFEEEDNFDENFIEETEA